MSAAGAGGKPKPAIAGAEEDDDDQPLLSSRALEALREFLSEQGSVIVGEEGAASPGEVRLVAEDWRLSQFWYDRKTAETVADEVRRLCSSGTSRVACISCPTLYGYLKDIMTAPMLNAERQKRIHLVSLPMLNAYAYGKKIDPNISVQLFEYDKRFEQYGIDFTFYDYNQPEDLPLDLKHAFQVVVADPPYLSEECLEKVTQTITFLACPKDFYLLLLTGDVQKERAAKLLNMHPCVFRPQHTNKLGNEFRLFTNYDPVYRLGGWELAE